MEAIASELKIGLWCLRLPRHIRFIRNATLQPDQARQLFEPDKSRRKRRPQANTEGKDYRTGRNDGAEIGHNRDHLRRTNANQNTNYASQLMPSR